MEIEVSNETGRVPVTVFHITGEGQTIPPGVDGSFAGLTPPTPLLPVFVVIGGKPADITYAGGGPGLARSGRLERSGQLVQIDRQRVDDFAGGHRLASRKFPRLLAPDCDDPVALGPNELIQRHLRTL